MPKATQIQLHIVFFVVVNHPVSHNCIGSRLIQIWGVITIKVFYLSQIVCLMEIKSESSSHKFSMRWQLSHNHLVIVLFVLKDYFQLRILLKYIICNLP